MMNTLYQRFRPLFGDLSSIHSHKLLLSGVPIVSVPSSGTYLPFQEELDEEEEEEEVSVPSSGTYLPFQVLGIPGKT